MNGERLGHYLIEREIGSGGMGRVFAATVVDRAAGMDPGQRVAVKVVHPHLLETAGFFKRFLREAQVGRSIRHENVVRTLDCDQEMEDGRARCFLVMEYVEGQTLAALLQELERVPEELCRHIAREVCKGLAAMHAAGAVHRDLKPENVLITPDHVVKVMDLGVALLADEQVRLSQTGAFVGSVEYASPEQFQGGTIDARTDLHALGVLLYELSSGAHPFRGSGFHDTLRRVCFEEPRRLGQVNPQLSAFFEEVVHTLLVKDPRGRFGAAAETLDVLAQCEAGTWWQGRARELRATTRRPLRRIRIPRETAVYGRDKELATLHGLCDLVRSGQGQVVLLEGEAGIGKSRLVDELISRLETAGEDVNFLFGSYPPGGAASAAGAFSTAFREHFGESGAGSHLPQIPVLVPAFDAVLRGEVTPDGVERLTMQSLATCFVHASRALGAERTTVVLIDDLHFAPGEAHELFAALATAIPGDRVLLIGTTRPGATADWAAELVRLPHASRVTVPRLGPKDLVLLLEESLRSRHLAQELSAKIAVKSDGNPFFAFEIVRGLREGQFITRTDDGTWVSTQAIDEIEIPASVLDLVNARVADLTEDERDMLEVASCCGFEFDPAVVADACGRNVITALKQLGRIEKRHRLIRAAGRLYAFDHHQVQEALYQGLHETLREHYHAALAGALQARTGAVDREPAELGGPLCFELSSHFLMGARGHDALRYLECAQSYLDEAYLHAETARLGEQALAMPGLLAGVDRARMLLRVAGAFDRMARRTRQEECARSAGCVAEEVGDDELRGQAARALGDVLLSTSRYDDAEAALGDALEIALARGDRIAEADALDMLSGVCFTRGRLPEARAHSERALMLCEETGDRQGAASSMMKLGNVCWAESRLSDAEALYQRALIVCREMGNRRGEATATGNIGLVCAGQGRPAEAREHDERALALYRDIGDREGEARVILYLGSLVRAQHGIAAAREQLEHALSLFIEIGNRQGEASALLDLGSLLQAEGRYDEARERYERTLAISQEIGYRRGESLAVGNIGNILKLQGHLSEARETHEKHLELCRALSDRAGEGRAIGNLGSVAWSRGRPAEAAGYYEQLLALAREIGDRTNEAIALNSLGRVHRTLGDDARALEHLQSCVAIAGEAGAQQALAEAHLALGAIASRAGEAESTRASLVAAMGAASDLPLPQVPTLVRCHLACLDTREVPAALAALEEHVEQLSTSAIAEARYLLWKATADAEHLVAAKHNVDKWLEDVDADVRDDCARNLRVPRDVLAAWQARATGAGAGADAGDSVDDVESEPCDDESATRGG